MSYPPFSVDWINQFSDPYAVMGLSVTADDRRALKRYRTVAKLLHPDSQALTDRESREFASDLFAKLVNPAYQRLKQEKGRADTLAMLRFRVRRLTRDAPLDLNSESARRLLKTPVPSVEVFYEQTITKLAEMQYQPIHQFETITHEMAELNLVFLRLKMGEPMIREKRTGLVSAPQAPPAPVVYPHIAQDVPSVDYAERHYLRAQEYLKKGNCQMAVQELRDAIKLEAGISKYHALLARTYMMQDMPGAAKAYCRQALKLDSSDRLALACAKILKLDVNNLNGPPKEASPAPAPEPPQKSGGLFGLFSRRR